MKTITTFRHNNNTYKVCEVEFKSKVDANGGAAPWKIGCVVKNYRRVLYINDIDVCEISYNTKEDLIEAGKHFGY